VGNTVRPSSQAPRALAFFFGVFLAVEFAVAFYLLMVFWPPLIDIAQSLGDEPAQAPVEVQPFGFTWLATADGLTLAVVAVAGALGATLASCVSFADYIGNRSLRSSWLPWYFFRLPVSVGLALMVYFAIRGGLLNINASGADLNPYAVVAVAGFTGLFSKMILDRLNEWASERFRIPPAFGDEARADTIVGARQLRATSLDASEVPSGVTEARTLTLHGEGFVQESIVRVSPPGKPGTERETTYGGPDTLTVKLLLEDLAEPGTLQLSVFNPESGNVSEPIDLLVGAPEE